MAKKIYYPSQKILENYADVLVNFALGGGKGIKKGDIVYLVAEEYAKPLYIELQKAIWRAGGHVISSYRPSHNNPGHSREIIGRDLGNSERDFFLMAENHQLEFFPAKYMKGLLDTVDHSIFILSETDKQALKGIDPKKIMQRGKAQKTIHGLAQRQGKCRQVYLDACFVWHSRYGQRGRPFP